MSIYTPDEANKIIALRKADVWVYWLSGLCPVQAQGWIDKHPFYFRARHDRWTIRVLKVQSYTLDKAVEWDADVWERGEPYGELGGEDAGYMPFIDALQFIEDGARWFRERNK